MRRASIGAVVLGGLILAAPAAMAQTNVAYASAPRSDYVVFFNPGSDHLSPVARETVRQAAEAALAARTVHVAGRPDQVAAVKAELVRAGVPAGAIVVARETGGPLPPTGDGISDLASRRVEITF